MARAVSPAVGVVVLVSVTVVLAATVAAALPASLAAGPPVARLALAADAGPDRVALTHRGGDPLNVTHLAVTVRIEGEPLARQPPVPFFAANGFAGGPTGPFNRAADPDWTAGETASVRLAATNRPGMAPGDRVTVRLSTDRGVVATLETRAD